MFLQELRKNSPKSFALRDGENSPQLVTKIDELCVKIAALCHDLGKLPDFSTVKSAHNGLHFNYLTTQTIIVIYYSYIWQKKTEVRHICLLFGKIIYSRNSIAFFIPIYVQITFMESVSQCKEYIIHVP